MLYRRTSDLPACIRKTLSPHAQDIYLDAFNDSRKRRSSPFQRHSPEESARLAAWATVKLKCKERGASWVA